MKERRRVAIQNAEKRWQEDNNINTGVTPSLNNGNPDNHTVSLGFESLSHYTEVRICLASTLCYFPCHFYSISSLLITFLTTY